VGIAASAAVLGLLALNYYGSTGSVENGPIMAAQQIAAHDQDGQALSYVVPQDTDATWGVSDPIIQQPIRLTNYLVRHGEYAIGIGRTSIHSSVVSGQDTWRVADQASSEE
jgi:hypothetical protein